MEVILVTLCSQQIVKIWQDPGSFEILVEVLNFLLEDSNEAEFLEPDVIGGVAEHEGVLRNGFAVEFGASLLKEFENCIDALVFLEVYVIKFHSKFFH